MDETSGVKGDFHAPFCGSPGARFPRATRRAFVRAPDRTNKTEDKRTYSAGRILSGGGCRGAGLAGHGVGSPKSSSPSLAPRRKTKPVQVSAESVAVITRVADEGGQAAGEDLVLAAG